MVRRLTAGESLCRRRRCMRRPEQPQLEGASAVKPYRGPPMTLGAAAAAQVRLIVSCKACQHQVEPDPAEWLLGTARILRSSMAREVGLFRVRLPRGRFCGDRDGAPIRLLPSAALRFPFVLCLRVPDRLPLHVRGCVGATARKRFDMILYPAGTSAARQAGRRTRMR